MTKNKYTSLGTMMQSKKDDPNDPNRFYIKLEQRKEKDGTSYGDQIFPITLANGVVLKDGDTLTMFSKREQFERSVKDGKMSQETADKLSFLKFDICLKEAINDGASDSNDPNKINF